MKGTAMRLTRRELLQRLFWLGAVSALPLPIGACRVPAPETGERAPDAQETALTDYSPPEGDDEERLHRWADTLRAEGLATREVALGLAAARVGELALGTPYEAFTLEEYLRAGGSPMRTEPLTLSLTRFDCVSLVESCLAVSRVAAADEPVSWEAYGREMERMRYRDGQRGGYATRLHYFSEWLVDNERRGLVDRITQRLGGQRDDRPLRFMTSNRDSYPGLAEDAAFVQLAERERQLDAEPRWVIPTARIPEIEPEIRSGDILAFATSIDGLDVTHSAFAYRDQAGTLRVLHAPLSGGVVEITRSTVLEYVRAIRRATGIMVARPTWS
jgi:hypothetical protein